VEQYVLSHVLFNLNSGACKADRRIAVARSEDWVLDTRLRTAGMLCPLLAADRSAIQHTHDGKKGGVVGGMSGFTGEW